MADFVNTIELLGDEAVINSILDGSISEFADDLIEQIRDRCFSGCAALASVTLPNVVTVKGGAFCGCTSLERVYIPNLVTIRDGMGSVTDDSTFSDCSALKEVVFPYVTSIGKYSFARCASLQMADFSALTTIRALRAFVGCTSLVALILRNENAVCTLSDAYAFQYYWSYEGANSAIHEGTGYIYVPKSLIEDYKIATNWSVYADQFRALEDYTVDGTVTGLLARVTNNLVYVTNSNADVIIGRSYCATLTPIASSSISSAIITMDGADVTAEVYNVETGEISIPAVTGDITITAEAGNPTVDVFLAPLNGLSEGELPRQRLDVTAGMVLEITYYLTKNQGYVYDGRSCGLSYILADNVVNEETTLTVTIPSDGYIVFSDFRNSAAVDGELGTNASDRLYGQYLCVTIIGG